MQFNKVLFGVDKKGGFKVWMVEVHGSEIHVIHGKLGGRLQRKMFMAKPKNVGRANATTAEQQALLEATSRVNKQIDKGYRTSQEEAVAASQQQLLPVLASDFTKCKKPDDIFPCYTSYKLDGVRCVASHADNLRLMSRGGKDYPIPSHIDIQLGRVFEAYGSFGKEIKFDGELYIHGEYLQNIVSAVKKPNELTPDIEFWIFDVPSNDPFADRLEDLLELQTLITELGLTHIKVVPYEKAANKDEAYTQLQEAISEGFEGLMLRSGDAPYEWNHRSRNLWKWKEFQEKEFRVIDCEEDNLQEAVYHLDLGNGAYFKAKPRGTHAHRCFGRSNEYIGRWVTVRFQQYSLDNVPIFPVIIAIRECDENGKPVE